MKLDTSPTGTSVALAAIEPHLTANDFLVSKLPKGMAGTVEFCVPLATEVRMR